MPALQRLAANLGVGLQELTAEDGARLHQIIWRLEREIHRSPRDVETHKHLGLGAFVDEGVLATVAKTPSVAENGARRTTPVE